MRILLYRALFVSALAAALLGLTVIFKTPKGLMLPFVLSIIGNLAFATAAFAKVMLLKGEKAGKSLPGWTKVWVHSLGCSFVAIMSSMLTFSGP
jgi:hypothetical protein